MTDSFEILADVNNGVALLTLNRPANLNAINMDMFHKMWILLTNWANDPEIRCVVVRGAGEKSFCSGGDCPCRCRASWRRCFYARSLSL